MFIIKILKKLIKALHSNASPSEIASGVVLGSIMGFTPGFTLVSFLVIFLIIILNVNISAAIVSSIIFSIGGLALDPLSHMIGSKVLYIPGLEGLWTSLYNMPLVPLSRFNNTVVIGGYIITLVLIIPIYIFSKKFVVVYREKLQAKIEKMKVVKLLKASKFFKFYTRLKG
jgi:uncharacterized protein (TIGR03546 family)